MAQQSIDLGTAGTNSGDTIREAFDKCNDNFNDTYKKGDGGYLNDTQQILILPGDFTPNKDSSTYNIGIGNYGGYIRAMSSVLEPMAQYVIPKGYKVTKFRLNASSSITVRLYKNNIGDQGYTQLGTGLSNVEINSTDVSANGTDYVTVFANTTSTSHYIWGGYLKIQLI